SAPDSYVGFSWCRASEPGAGHLQCERRTAKLFRSWELEPIDAGFQSTNVDRSSRFPESLWQDGSRLDINGTLGNVKFGFVSWPATTGSSCRGRRSHEAGSEFTGG